MKNRPTVESRASSVERRPGGAPLFFRPRLSTLDSRLAFTLVELLTVIGIIAALAAFLLPAAAAISKRQKINRTQTELAQLETALDRYHAAYGFYPPDNPSGNGPLTNQLYFELLGTTNTGTWYFTLDGTASNSVAAMNATFGVSGFMNCSKPGAGEDALVARNFLPDLAPQRYGEISTGVKVLLGSVGGPDATYRPMGQPGLNPWRYNSSNPTNNPGAYDLWIQLVIGGKTNLVCNWSRQVQINNPLP
jgi:type II secretory pathway pseudopilin PulG